MILPPRCLMGLVPLLLVCCGTNRENLQHPVRIDDSGQLGVGTSIFFRAGLPAAPNTVSYLVNDDGSGRVIATRCHFPEALPAQSVIHGATITRASTVEAVGGPFADLSKVNVGGLRAEFDRDGTGFLFTLTIPLGKNVAWVERFGPTKPQVERLVALVERTREREKAVKKPPDIGGSDFDPSAFAFSVMMPGKITGSELRGNELPEGWRIESGTSGSGCAPIALFIPFGDLEGPPRKVVWEIRCGEPEAGQEDWKRLIHRLLAEE